MDDEDIDSILSVSRKNNQLSGITGVLLYVEGNILQIIEGEQAAVETLFARIKEDTRHHGVVCMLKEYREQRLFSGWSMGYKQFSSRDIFERLPELKTLKFEKETILNAPDVPQTIQVMIDSFLKSVNA